MKKIMIVLVSIFIVIGMSGCFENPTAPPATVYDPTPTATSTPEESVTPEETPDTDEWLITFTGETGGTFIFCYGDAEEGGFTACSTERVLEDGVWSSLLISCDILAIRYQNTTSSNLVMKINRNGEENWGGETTIPPGYEWPQMYN